MNIINIAFDNINMFVETDHGHIYELNFQEVLQKSGVSIGNPAAVLFHPSRLKNVVIEKGELFWYLNTGDENPVFQLDAERVIEYGTKVDFAYTKATHFGLLEKKAADKPTKKRTRPAGPKRSKEYWQTHSPYTGATLPLSKTSAKVSRQNSSKKAKGSSWSTVKDYEDITYKKSGGVARIAFNRPEIRNAFRPKTLFELEEALKDAREDIKVGVVLLTGEGPAKDGKFAFCSGGDQKVRGARGYEGDDGVQRLNVLDIQRLIRVMSKVVICVVPGWAVGGGHSLHVVCDMTIASKEHAIFKQTDADVASFDGGYGSAYLAKQVGQKRAREIFFLGRNYSAQEAFDMGMVNAVVPHAELEDTAFEWAQEILKKSPTAIRMIKFAFNLTDEGIAGQQVFAGEATRLAYMTEEAEEGRKAFLEKRDPDFSKFPWLSL